MKQKDLESKGVDCAVEAPSRRGLASLVAGAVGLGMGLGLDRAALSAPSTMTVLINKKDAGEVPMHALIEEALASGDSVELLAKVGGNLYRANFKIEIEG